MMRSIRSTNPNDYNNRRINGLIRLKETKISLCGELEMKNRLFQENQAKDCQEIEELRRICCEETDQASHAIIDELSVRQERNPATVSQLAQNRELQNKVNSLSDARQLWNDHVCRTIHGILWVLQETFLNDHLLEKDEPPLSSTIQRIWHALAKNRDLILQDKQRGRRVKRDENRKNSSIPVPRF